MTHNSLLPVGMAVPVFATVVLAGSAAYLQQPRPSAKEKLAAVE